jgi:hypothetical protein
MIAASLRSPKVAHLCGHIRDGPRRVLLPQVFSDDAVFDLSDEQSTDIGGEQLVGVEAIRRSFQIIDHTAAHHVSHDYEYEPAGQTRSQCEFIISDMKRRMHR